MIYRGPGFLAVLLFGSSPAPSPSPVSKLDWQHTGRPRKRENLMTGEGEGEGEEPNHTTARTSSINHAILSVYVLQH